MKPEIRTLSTQDVLEIMGPAQAGGYSLLHVPGAAGITTMMEPASGDHSSTLN